MINHPWVDAHIHVSNIDADGAERAAFLADLLDVLDRSGSDLRFIISCDAALTQRIIDDPGAMLEVNGLIHEWCRQAPGRLYGSCTINPHYLDESLRCMDACFDEWGFVQFGEMLQYTMDYEMDTDAVETLVKRAAEIDVPTQVHVSTSNARTGASSFGDEQLQDLFRLVRRVPEARYVLAHIIGNPKGDPPVVEGYLDAIDGEFGEFPRNFWAEIRDFDSPGVRTALDRVPSDRLIAGTDWTTRIGPPFLPYGMVFGNNTPEENPYYPSIQSMIELLRSAGCADEQIRRIGWRNAAELYGLKE